MEGKNLRIDKIVSSQTNYSRKHVKKLIKEGSVQVDGVVVKTPQSKYNPCTAEISVLGEVLKYQKYIYIMMNKPKGILSASEDRYQETVIDLVPKELFREGLFPAGRLDRDTTGFVLITNDGDFAHRVLSPKNNIKKKYYALIDKNITDEDIEKFQEGIVTNHGSVFKPAEIKKVRSEVEGDVVEIVITEGKYHQIKRMVATINAEVLSLKRESIGGLKLDENMAFGECREITPKELATIM